MSKLPEEFAELETRWGDWIIESEPDRVRHRERVPLERLKSFYDDMLPRVDEILKYLDRFALSELPPQPRNLWWLMASLASVGMTLELYGSQQAIPGGYILAEVQFRKKWDSHELLQ